MHELIVDALDLMPTLRRLYSEGALIVATVPNDLRPRQVVKMLGREVPVDHTILEVISYRVVYIEARFR
jgi:hypothetical protein